MCELSCGAPGDFFREFPVKFRPACRLWVCGSCAASPAAEALRELNFHELSAHACVGGVALGELRVRRSSGLLEGGWYLTGAASLVLAVGLTEVRACVAKGRFTKFVPLRSLRAHNPSWLGSRLVWRSEPHLSEPRRRQWEWRWRDALHWQERAVALLWTFGDDGGRPISAL